MSDESTEREQLDTLLNLGKQSKQAEYFALIKKLNEQGILPAKEQRILNILDKELKEKRKEINTAERDTLGLRWTDAAAYLGISTKKLSVQVTRGYIRQEPDGIFLFEELERWKEQARNISTPTEETLLNLRQRAELSIKQTKAKKEELAFKQMTEQYVPIEEVYHVWAERVKEISTGLINWANSLPPLLEGLTKHEMTVILTAEARSLLERFSRTGRWTPEQPAQLDDGQRKTD